MWPRIAGRPPCSFKPHGPISPLWPSLPPLPQKEGLRGGGTAKVLGGAESGRSRAQPEPGLGKDGKDDAPAPPAPGPATPAALRRATNRASTAETGRGPALRASSRLGSRSLGLRALDAPGSRGDRGRAAARKGGNRSRPKSLERGDLVMRDIPSERTKRSLRFALPGSVSTP